MYQSNLCWGLLLLLLLLWLPWPHAVRGLDVNAAGGKEEASRVLVALSYPSVRIGPYNWRYFRGKALELDDIEFEKSIVGHVLLRL